MSARLTAFEEEGLDRVRKVIVSGAGMTWRCGVLYLWPRSRSTWATGAFVHGKRLSWSSRPGWLSLATTESSRPDLFDEVVGVAVREKTQGLVSAAATLLFLAQMAINDL